MIDPYPAELMDTDLTPTAEPDPLVRAINRLAQAIEQQVLATLDNRPQPLQNAPQAPTGLAPLPPVQIVAAKPSCPYHGPDKASIASPRPVPDSPPIRRATAPGTHDTSGAGGAG